MDYIKLRKCLFNNLGSGRKKIQAFVFTVPELFLGGGAGALRGVGFFLGDGLLMAGACCGGGGLPVLLTLGIFSPL